MPLMILLISLAFSDEMPTLMVADLADGGASGLLDLAVVEAFQRYAPLHELLLEYLAKGTEPVLG